MKRWKINLYTLWFSQIISLMSFNLGLPFMAFYIQEIGVTDPEQVKFYTGLIAAAPAITMGIMAPIWGMIGDKYGKKLMLLRAMLSASVILSAIGLSTKVEHLVILRVLQGFLTGTVTASGALVASGTPENQLSSALGFMSSSTFIGYAAGPAIGGFISEALGYRTSFYIGGFLMFIDFLLVLFLVKEEKPKYIEQKKKISLKDSFNIFTPLIISMLFILLFLRIARTIFNPYLALYLQEIRGTLEGTPKLTGIINGITGLMTAVSGITISRLGDKYNNLNIIKILAIIGIMISFLIFKAGNMTTFIIMYSLFFLFVGGIEPVIMSINSKSVPPEKRGALFGFQALMGSVGWAFAPMIGGFVSIRYNIHTIIILIPIFLSFALCTVFFICRNKKYINANQSTN